MAHELLIENGEASMFYIGEVPWHGLGTRLDRPATAEEAIAAARLDWRVNKAPLFAQDQGAFLPVPDRYAVVRENSREVLGVVGKDYTPLQNREAFSFFDPIVGQDAAIYHTAGALGKGEKVWILAKLPDCIRVIGDDIAEKYLLLANGHDGRTVVQLRFTPVRVVCQNTLTSALSQSGQVLRIPHFHDVHERLKAAEKTLGIIRQEFSSMEDTFRQMVRYPMNRDRLERYLGAVFPMEDEEPEAKERVQKARNWSEYFFEQGTGNQERGVKGTLWAAYNGVTEWVDHRKIRQNPNQRLNSVWFGEGYRTKARALGAAKELMQDGLN